MNTAPLPDSSCNLGGLVLKEGDPQYDDYAKIWNQRYSHIRPWRINVVESVDDIRKAIECARTHGIPLRIKSGGHNYEGFSMVSNGIVVHLGKLKAFTIDSGARTCTFGPGWLQKDLNKELKKGQEKYIISGGVCPDVAAIPVILGGGTGCYHRKYGLTCDTVTSLTVMTADGKLNVCDSEQNSELFWACRGAGNGNFGVVTSATVRIFPAPEGTPFKIVWRWDERVVHNWQQWLATATPEIASVSLELGDYDNIGRPQSIICKGLCIGNREDYKRAVADLVSMDPHPIEECFTFETADEIGQLTSGYSDRDALKQWAMESALIIREDEALKEWRWKSTGLISDRIMSPEDVKQVGDLMQRTPQTFAGFSIAFVALGGVVDTVNPRATAYPHRKALYMMRIVGRWEDAANDRGNLYFHQLMKTLLARQTESQSYYFNYSDLEVDNYMKSYFAANQQRLIQVKSDYDRDNFFSYQQSIPSR